MSRTALRIISCAALIWSAASSESRSASLFQSVFVFSAPGTQTGPYEIQCSPFDGTVVAPDGTVFSENNNSIKGLGQAELLARFVGQWTINDAFGLPTGQFQQHQFNVSAENLVSEFAPVPVVLSPDEGVTVPRIFRVQWEDWDTRATFGIRRPIDATLTWRSIGPDHFEFNATFPQNVNLIEVEFTAYGSRFDTLPMATSLTSNPENRWTPQVWRRNPSLPRSFYVENVPEPLSCALLSAPALGLQAIVRTMRRREK